jgi:ankyrin repeat protein
LRRALALWRCSAASWSCALRGRRGPTAPTPSAGRRSSGRATTGTVRGGEQQRGHKREGGGGLRRCWGAWQGAAPVARIDRLPPMLSRPLLADSLPASHVSPCWACSRGGGAAAGGRRQPLVPGLQPPPAAALCSGGGACRLRAPAGGRHAAQPRPRAPGGGAGQGRRRVPPCRPAGGAGPEWADPCAAGSGARPPRLRGAAAGRRRHGCAAAAGSLVQGSPASASSSHRTACDLACLCGLRPGPCGGPARPSVSLCGLFHSPSSPCPFTTPPLPPHPQPTPSPLLCAAEAKRRTALHLAAAQGRVELARQVLAAARAAVSAKDADGWLPIHGAAAAGHADIVAALLAAGSDVEDPAADGDSPLHKAALGGHLEVVRLLKGRAQLDQRNASGSTALYNAASQGHLAVMRELAEEGAAGEGGQHRAAAAAAASRQSFCPAWRKGATCSPLPALCFILVRTPPPPPGSVDAATTNGCSPLYIAANNGWAAAAGLLLELGAHPDAETSSGCTPLHAGEAPPLHGAARQQSLAVGRQCVGRSLCGWLPWLGPGRPPPLTAAPALLQPRSTATRRWWSGWWRRAATSTCRARTGRRLCTTRLPVRRLHRGLRARHSRSTCLACTAPLPTLPLRHRTAAPLPMTCRRPRGCAGRAAGGQGRLRRAEQQRQHAAAPGGGQGLGRGGGAAGGGGGGWHHQEQQGLAGHPGGLGWGRHPQLWCP